MGCAQVGVAQAKRINRADGSLTRLGGVVVFVFLGFLKTLEGQTQRRQKSIGPRAFLRGVKPLPMRARIIAKQTRGLRGIGG